MISVEKLNAIFSAVAPCDAGYNRRLVAVLRICGYDVSQDVTCKDGCMMPVPWREGWQFPYPSMIVPCSTDAHPDSEKVNQISRRSGAPIAQPSERSTRILQMLRDRTRRAAAATMPVTPVAQPSVNKPMPFGAINAPESDPRRIGAWPFRKLT